jgi:hypothetical protein
METLNVRAEDTVDRGLDRLHLAEAGSRDRLDDLRLR